MGIMRGGINSSFRINPFRMWFGNNKMVRLLNYSIEHFHRRLRNPQHVYLNEVIFEEAFLEEFVLSTDNVAGVQSEGIRQPLQAGTIFKRLAHLLKCSQIWLDVPRNRQGCTIPAEPLGSPPTSAQCEGTKPAGSV